MTIVPHIPKGARYTIGARIENKFLDLLEHAYAAYYCPKEQKSERIAECIVLLDVLKFLLTTAWEGRCIANAHFETVAAKLAEVGRMLGAWKKSLENPEKKNRTV